MSLARTSREIFHYIKVRGTVPGSKFKIANAPYYPSPDSDFEKREAHANARLIAAAPELLRALQGVIAAIDRSDLRLADGWRYQTIKDVDAARAAIAKATR